MANDDDDGVASAESVAANKGLEEKLAATEEVLLAARQSVTASKDTSLSQMSAAVSAVQSAVSNAENIASELANSKSRIETAKTEILAEFEQHKAAIQAVRASAETFLAEIEKQKTAAATARGALDTVQQSAAADLAAINQTKTAIDKQKLDADATSGSLLTDYQKITKQIDDLQAQAGPLEEILTVLTGIRDDATLAREGVESDIKLIAASRDNFQTLTKQTQERYDALVQQDVALKTQISEIGAAYEKIKEFHKELLDEKEKKSVRSQIEALKKSIDEVLADTSKRRDEAVAFIDTFKKQTASEHSSLLKEQRERFSSLHTSLEAEIRALLPSAGAAGLASTYYDAKSRYAPTSFAGKPGDAYAPGNQSALKNFISWLRRRFGYNPASIIATVFFYALFILPIVGIVLIFYDLVHELPRDSILALDYRIVILRLLIAIPLAAISTFGLISLNQYRRLYEEYNHKQRVMELYASFSKEIAENGTKEQQEQLLSIMLNAVADKSYLAQTPLDKQGAGILAKGNNEVVSQLNNITALLNNLSKMIKT